MINHEAGCKSFENAIKYTYIYINGILNKIAPISTPNSFEQKS